MSEQPRLPWWRKTLVIAPLSFALGASVVAGLVAYKRHMKAEPLFWKLRAAELEDPFTRSDLERQIEEEFSIQIIGSKDSARLETLRRNLRIIHDENPVLLSGLHDMYLMNPKDASVAAYLGRGDVFGRIELLEDSLSVTAHEIAHTYHFSLRNREEFNARWHAVAGNAYSQLRGVVKIDDTEENLLYRTWEDGTFGPNHGCVRPYGATNVYEDVATFVGDSYETDTPFVRANPNDPRYRQKLGLLLEYGFITQERHDLLDKSIGAKWQAPKQ